MNDDRDLRDAFARLRQSDLSQTPRFRTACTQPRPRKRMIPAIAASLLLAIVAAAYLLRTPPAPVQHPQPIASPISAWRAPTDFLLQTPGAELTSSVPRFQPTVPNAIKGDRS